MKLLGFLKNGKGMIHETGELSPTFGSIDVVKELDNGWTRHSESAPIGSRKVHHPEA